MKKIPMCNLCGKVFSRRDNLERHLNNHQGEKLFFCEFCGKSFLRKSYLKLHHRIHSGERPFQCGVCGRSFTRDDHLLRHHRSHQGYKPYTCDVCGKALSRRDHLAVHRRIHTGERPFKCELCQCEFTRSDHLLKHKRLNLCESSSCVSMKETMSAKTSEFDGKKEMEEEVEEGPYVDSHGNQIESINKKHYSKNAKGNIDGSCSSSSSSSSSNSSTLKSCSNSIDSQTFPTPQNPMADLITSNTIIAAPAPSTTPVALVTNDLAALLPNATKLYSIPCNGNTTTGFLTTDSAGTAGMPTQIYQTATGAPSPMNPITHIFPTIQISPATTQLFSTIQMYPSPHINLQQHTPLNQKLHISGTQLNHTK
ncbi:zinc finger protein 470-like [Argonauta hians]